MKLLIHIVQNSFVVFEMKIAFFETVVRFFSHEAKTSGRPIVFTLVLCSSVTSVTAER